MLSPALTATIHGENKTLYMANTPQFKEATAPNLKMTLQELGLTDGVELIAADRTRSNTMRLLLHLASSMETTTENRN